MGHPRDRRKGPPVRLFLENCEHGGVMASTPSAAFRMRMALGSQFTPEFSYRPANSEYVLKGPIVVAEGTVVLADERFPPLFRITDQGNVVWVAGSATWKAPDGHIRQTTPAVSEGECLGLLASPAELDRQEGCYSLPFVAKAKGPNKDVLDALVTALGDKGEHVRRTAAESLTRLGDSSVVDALKRCAEQDASGWCREVAQEGIKKIAPGTELRPKPGGQDAGSVTMSGNIGGSVNVGGQSVRYSVDPASGRGTYWLPSLFD